MNTKNILTLAVLYLLSVPAWSQSAAIAITATVTASCTLEAPQLVTLKSIPYSVLAGKVTGDDLPDYATTFDIKSNCVGTDKYTYTFTPNVFGAAIKCLGSDKGALRFCLKVGDQDINFLQGPFILNGHDEVTTISVTPQVGPTVSPGAVTGTMIVTIEPA